ncbi:hypothetical protein NBT05_12470 [Aquimarina sp. ERC-38]|uniref:hypothetical protein n=1 Tax=Aquimarina sp. ERC-38 TaxID=2949996 RepID=UPI0022460724|nr:hypothetical protein [Aquimarina sp. ERC-38]UZO79763.1 hypothetical protein NBT05_12470 [Aquimarina sp. ERC-38]
MRKIITLILLIFISINSYSQSDKELILESFDNYKNAILTDKGKLAADFVDSRTMNYYSTVLDKVKMADSLEIDTMGIIDKLTVLTMRHRVSKKDLLSFNGKDLFVYAIDNGMVGKNSVVNAELGDVVTNGDFSKAEFVVNGQKTPFFFHFYRENKIWKVDITHLFLLGTIAFKKMVEDSGETENDFITNILEVLTGKKPSENIWKPII